MKSQNKTKTIAIASALGIAALGVTLGTISYFTDTDTKTNTFTVGNVEIEVVESSLHRVNAGPTLNPASPLYSDVAMEGVAGGAVDMTGSNGWAYAYYTDEQILADAENYDTDFTGVVPGFDVHKMPYIRNTGTTSAYVRGRFLIPSSIFETIDAGRPYSMWTKTAVQAGDDATLPVTSRAIALYYDYLMASHGDANYTGDYDDYIAAMRNTTGLTDTRCADPNDQTTCVEYLVFDFTYKDPLAAGEMTFWNMWGNIAVDKNATADDLADFDIIVEADGIQATGFANATEAFAAFDAQN